MRSPALRWPSHPDIDRNDPSLVLYAPLWKTEMQGSAPVSLDLNKHVCTVTGATWGSQGRTFDGTDDKIAVSDSSVMRFGAGNFSIVIGIKFTTADDYDGIVGKMDTGVTLGYNLGVMANGKARCYVEGSGAAGISKEFDSAINNGAWHSVGYTVNRASSILFYVDGVPDGTLSAAGVVGNVNPTGTMVIGRDSYTLGTGWFTGSIGEVIIYNRALSAAEILNLYTVTKWRYQ